MIIGKLNLWSTPTGENDKNLKIIVKQNEKTYTQGPYTINFDNQDVSALCGYETMGELVYKEITKYYDGWTRKNAFCIGDIGAEITFEDGHKEIVDSSKVTLLDKRENEIEFPKFGEDFYIKYNSQDKDIKEIRPLIRITYLKKITNEGRILHTYTYKSTSIKFEMLQDNASLLRDAINATAIFEILYGGGGAPWLISRKSDVPIFKEHWTTRDAEGGELDVAGLTSNFGHSVSMYIKAEIEDKLVDWGLSDVEVTLEVQTGLTDKSRLGHFWGVSGVFHKEVTYAYPIYNDKKEVIGYEYEGVSYLEITGEDGVYYVKGTTGRRSTTENIESDAFLDLLANLSTYEVVVKITGITISCKIGKIQPSVLLEDFDDELDLYGLWGTLTIDQLDEDTSINYNERRKYGIEREKLHGREINMFIGGNVWQDIPSAKLGEFLGKRSEKSLSMAGIQVELYDQKDDSLCCVTTTDEQGEYGFQKLNPMHKYYIKFRYDGMRYEDSTYKNKLTGGYSTAQESSDDRSNFNERFAHINSSPNNYDTNKKAYRSVHKD